MTKFEKLKEYGIYFAYLTCFTCMFSTALTSTFSILMVLCWIASGAFKNLPEIINKNSITIIGIAFNILLLIGVIYSPATIEMSLDFLKKYRVLLFIPILISLTEGNSNTGKNIVAALLLGYFLIIANTYLVEFGLIEMNKLAYKRFTGGFQVIFAYLVLQKIVTEKKYAILWGILFFVISYDIFFTLQNRTGWLIFIALTVLFIFQHFSIKKQFIFYAVSFCLLIVVFNTSDIVQNRVDQTIQNLKNYDIEKKASRTSIGLRLDWYQNSFELIKEKPIFGYGTGAYQAAQRKLLDKFSTSPTTEPHNEFLLTTVQIGLVGLAVFLALFIDPLLRSFQLIRLKKDAQAYALQATILYLFLGCLLNSWLLATVPSHIFFFLIVAFYPIREDDISGTI